MSYVHTRCALAVLDVVDLSARAAHLLLVLAARANKSGDSFPSLDRLASDLRRNRTNVLDAIAELEAAGLVMVERRHRKVNRYSVPADIDAVGGADATTLRSVDGGADATLGWRWRHPTSGASATPTSHEQVNELRAASTDDAPTVDRARARYEEYVLTTRAAGKRVLTPAVYFAVVGEAVS